MSDPAEIVLEVDRLETRFGSQTVHRDLSLQVRRGEVLARTTLEGDARGAEVVQSRLNLLLAAAFARAQRQGTLVDGLQFDGNDFNELGRVLADRPPGQEATLEATARSNADTPDPIVVNLRWVNLEKSGDYRRDRPS